MTLSYLVKKEAPYVYIHGSGCSKNIWIHQISEVGGYGIDLPGHGGSPDDENISSVEDYAKHVVDFIKTKIGKGYVIGHSLGGAVAQMTYLLSRDCVKGIVLVGSGARLRVLPEILWGFKNNFLSTAHKSIDFLFYKGFNEKEVIKGILDDILDCGSEICFRDFNACDKFDLLEKYKNKEIEINVPMLCIVGNKDVLTPPKYARFFGDVLGAKVEIIKDAGHMVMLEKPKEVNRVLIDFLT